MSSQDHKQALPAGFRLGSYRVVRVLGAGGFGVTYLCEHARLGVQVAVKEYLPNEIAVRDGTAVHPKSAGDREGFNWGLSRFQDEARTLARFEHPNVVRVRDCFEANSTAYIVMNYEDGESLDILLERHGTLTEAQLKCVVLPVADGLRQVHAAGFLHRDVKPSNIFVRRSDESPVLLDFGSARQALGRKSRSITAIVSAGYSPPEQYESHGDQGPWTDIYALSALCHRAIAGDVPVEAPRRTGQVARSRADPQARLAASGAVGYSSGFLEAVDWGLRVIETERPQSLDDWLARIDEAMSFNGSRRLAGRRELLLKELHKAEVEGGGTRTFDEAVRQCWEFAEQGDLEFQYALGVLYNYGGTRRDAREAALWYRKAAEQGHAAAQHELARQYALGEGVPQDAGEAMLWYRKAAEQGHSDAQYDLGALYCLSDGVHQDSSTAALWYRRAAEQGHADAQLELARLCYFGDGVPKDVREATQWCRKAAEQGKRAVGFLYDNGEVIPEDIRETALLWDRKPRGRLTFVTAAGNPVWFWRPPKWSFLRESYDKAVEGHAASQMELAYVYANGEGPVPKDVSKAAVVPQSRRAGSRRSPTCVGMPVPDGCRCSRGLSRGRYVASQGSREGRCGGPTAVERTPRTRHARKVVAA